MKKFFAALLCLCLLPFGAFALEVSYGEFANAQFVPVILNAGGTYLYELRDYRADQDNPAVYTHWYGADENGEILSCALDHQNKTYDYAANGILYRWSAEENAVDAALYLPGAYREAMIVRCAELAVLTPCPSFAFTDMGGGMSACAFDWTDDEGGEYSTVITIETDTLRMVQYETFSAKDGQLSRVASILTLMNPDYDVPEALKSMDALDKVPFTLHGADGEAWQAFAPDGLPLRLLGTDGEYALYTDEARTERFSGAITLAADRPITDLYAGELTTE